jgi:hypothetical protein
MAAIAFVVLIFFGWILNIINRKIESKVDLSNSVMGTVAVIAAGGVAIWLGYQIAQECAEHRLYAPGGKIFLIVFIPMCLACAWAARSIAIVIGYASIVFFGVGTVIWWIMGGNV